MKQLIVLIIGIFCFQQAAYAQFKVDVEAGMNLSHFKSSQDTDEKQIGGMKAGFQLGTAVSYEFKKHWMLMSGLSFAQTRNTMNLTDGTTFGYYFPKTDIELNHFIIPLKVGYNIRFNERFHLIPSVGWYGSIDFNAGNSALEILNPDGNGRIQTHWKPMDGFSYEPPIDTPYPYIATLAPFRNWTYGYIGGLKAVICRHYTVSLDYYESIKKGQKQNDLRNYGLQLSVGYQF